MKLDQTLAIVLGTATHLFSTFPTIANDDRATFTALSSKPWQQAFSDPCTGKWQDQWFLDGEDAEVRHENGAMTIDTANGYAVLWTRQSFAGDLRIEYDFKRVDSNPKGVNIIYIQATGDGQGGCVEDIAKWSNRRTKAAMSDYFLNMHTYHVSYATDKNDYIRGRRYLPLANKGLKGTQLDGELTNAGFFDDKKWMHITVIKRDKALWMEFQHPDKTTLCHFQNTDKPAITHGRVGLRLMPGRLSQFRNFRIKTAANQGGKKAPWQEYRGQPGPSGWRCHVIQPDPKDHGPDGINLHDWDGDGDLDAFVNAEEGKYSRLYFNPGPGKVRDTWSDYVEFKHGKCEDSGMGDLDNDGDIDYIANGGWVYFNPGKENVRDTSKWARMTLFDHERRVPTVADIDGDGRNDLVVGAQEWFRQPTTGKHTAANWTKHTIGKTRWPMNCILHDVDADGDLDMVVPDRGVEICWFVNPGRDKVTGPWQRKTLHKHHEPMFMTVADVNGDQVDDFVITGGSKGKLARKLIVLIRTNRKGDPTFREILIDQPSGLFPKGVAVTDLDGKPDQEEILVIPKGGDLWTATYTGDSMEVANWRAVPIKIPGSETRKKMDNAWLGDLDGDADLDIVTTEENGGWGVLWFENPAKP